MGLGCACSGAAARGRGRAGRRCRDGAEAPPPENEAWREFRKDVRTTVWSNRRTVADWTVSLARLLADIRGFFYVPESEEDKRKREETEKEQREKPPDLLATVAFIAAGTAVLVRVGGRAAIINVLGIDALQDSEIQQSVNSVLEVAESQDFIVKFLLILLAWIISKVFVLDFLGFPLAVADGVLFGILEGTLVSCTCATIGSSISFLLSRTFLYDKTRPRIDDAPGLRALETAVADKGATAVFTLRLAPILPIPIGSYAYIYGITRLPWIDFALGTFAGSAKPYFLDAYIGSIFKGLSSPDSGDPASDVLLFVTFVATIAAGSFASELAVGSFQELSREVEDYSSSVVSRRELPANDVRAADPLLRQQTVTEGLSFWGVQASDFPSVLGAAVLALNQAQEQQRCVYAERWLLRKPEEQPAGGFMPTKASNGSFAGAAFGTPGGELLLRTRPENNEAAVDWAPNWGVEAAQAVMTLPVFFEALGTYSNPELWPAVMAQVPPRPPSATRTTDSK